MRKGHRRTQSEYIAATTVQNEKLEKNQIHCNDVFELVRASEKKIETKVINYERLEISSLQENSNLKFGNFTIERINKMVKPRGNYKLQIPEQLNSIPENSKSSEISSQKLSKGTRKEDDLPTLPAKRAKQKRASDLKRPNTEMQNKFVSQNTYPRKHSLLGKSLKKK